ncbi:efflux RND transporter permease subunit [Cerasicoccus arenae]|uniref:Multidrug efflux RND transporter permease subunit n=1 Tax=Cerasicoccus arenae TaxID=424488 RepID=A0A8J3DBC7_9BACT|nr:multidrug efflux RND transporter permease subunit [Cerasicoccus arenae]MBK1857315.1 efflux RND transporter permease subunit [Cerasicoccus arenae]GHC00647.1 multidrug efflux RND transporter permease subunit [Cerasicoccus arenae]
MSISHYFIDRPRFAVVLSLVITIIGGISFFGLPTSQFPEVSPPTIVVRASLPGATPEILADTVAAPLEQEINGVENMMYMASSSTADGSVQITITFKLGTDLDTAQVLVQNRVGVAEPRLPEQTKQIGVIVEKSVPDLLLVVQMFSPDNSLDQEYVSNYAIRQIRESLRRIDGVGSVRTFGSREYSMRVWLDPERMANLSITAGDIVDALREQNIQVSAGIIGQQPNAAEGAFQLNVSTLGRISEVEQFEDVVVKRDERGTIVYLKDVARVELGAVDYNVNNYMGTTPAVAMPIQQRPGSNALETAQEIRAQMKVLAEAFPPGLDYAIIYDPTVFISESVDAVFHTIIEAIILVIIVIIVFLQSWRASLIPLTAIPISLIGTFAAMAVFGFSINNLSLFGLVLAIGIVVDDAIVVVENIERNLDRGLSNRDASRKAMDEITGPLISATLVMAAIFVPTAFLPGITGQFYRQFALTIAFSVAISGFVSLTLSPALGVILLKPHGAKPDLVQRIINFFFGWFFRAFNWAFSRFTNGYSTIVKRFVRMGFTATVIFAALIALTAWGFKLVPGGFIPPTDQGYGIIVLQLPDGASLDRTDELVREVAARALEVEGVANAVAFAGFNGATFSNATNAAAIFTPFTPFDERTDPELSGNAIIGRLRAKLGDIRDAFVIVIQPPSVRGIGNGGGWKMEIQDRAGLGYPALQDATMQLMMAASQEPGLTQVFSPFRAGVPQLYVDVDREKAKMLDVPLNNIFDTLQVFLGSLYINDVNLFGRTYRLTAQADAQFRDEKEDITRLKTRNAQGEMVPLGSMVNVKSIAGPDRVVRYNLYPAAELQGSSAEGYSTGQSLDTMERLAAKILPPGMSIEWTDLAYQEKQVGNSSLYIFPLAVLFVFFVLVAQYENWSLPLAVIIIVPISLFGAIWLLWYRGMDNNILNQIGFVVLIGLAAKNAILIVEFAKQQEDDGVDTYLAASEASRLRLRPILMTSFAFILGVIPLMIATGAGWEMRQALGTPVFGGMLFVTLAGIFLTPVFYVIIRRLTKRTPKHEHAH